jgi:hypothetical protein
VSLLVHRRAIARAVLGELAPREDARLRAHLRGCARCRAHYDGLARTAGALGSGRAAATREQDRLFAAIDSLSRGVLPARNVDPAAGAVPARRRRRFWLGAAFALVPATAVAVLLITRAGGDEITLRGSSASGAAPPATVVLYASRKLDPSGHGPVRLVGELPGSGEAHVSVDDYLQIGLRGLRAPGHVRVVGIDEGGRVHDYVGDTAVAPRGGPLTLGGSIDLGREHQPGRVRLLALFARSAVTDEAVRAAIAGGTSRGPERGNDAGTNLVTGLVVIAR